MSAAPTKRRFSRDEPNFEIREDSAARYNQLLIVKNLTQNTHVSCSAVNKHGQADRREELVVAGPSAVTLDHVDPGRSTINVHWLPPTSLNRPITHYTIYYTNNGAQPLKAWRKLDVNGETRQQACSKKLNFSSVFRACAQRSHRRFTTGYTVHNSRARQ